MSKRSLICLLSFILFVPSAFSLPPSESPIQHSTFDSPLRILFVSPSLYDQKADRDADLIDALRAPGLSWFTHVILKVPSWQEYPDAPDHLLIKHALNICRDRGIPVIWGRNLWVSWPEFVDGTKFNFVPPIPDASSQYDPAYFAAALATVSAEARRIGAVGTFLDTEPYGDSVHKLSLKSAELTEALQSRIRSAVQIAVASAGRVDFVYPSSSGRATHFAWPLLELGQWRCDSKAYYTTAPDYQLPKINPPTCIEHRLDLWGCNVGLGRPEDVVGSQVKLTIADVMALDLSVIRQQHPDCRGIWVYIDADIFPDVIRRGWQRSSLPPSPEPSNAP